MANITAYSSRVLWSAQSHCSPVCPLISSLWCRLQGVNYCQHRAFPLISPETSNDLPTNR